MHKLLHATTRDMPLVITSFFGKYDSDSLHEHTEIELVPVLQIIAACISRCNPSSPDTEGIAIA